MSKALLKRAEAQRVENQTRESVPGSGFHDNDRDPTKPQIFVAPQKNGLPRISQHLFPFYDFDDAENVTFVGPCAEKALAALQAWAKPFKLDKVSELPGTERKLILKIIPKLKLVKVEDVPTLSVRLCDWNDVLYALAIQGIGLTGAPLADPEQGS